MDISPPLSPGRQGPVMEDLSDTERARRGRLYMGLPEHVILCVDISAEMNTVWNGQTRLELLQTFLAGFIHYKLLLNRGHKIALCALGGDTQLILPFSSNEQEIVNALNSLAIVEQDTGPFDFGQFFTNIRSIAGPSIAIPKDPHNTTHLTRVVLIYGRSEHMPELREIDDLTFCNKSDSFFYDVLYLYKRAADGEGEQTCQHIYDFITSFMISPHRRELSLSQSSGTQRLLFNLQLLMAHPLQRDQQDKFIHKVDHLGS